MIRKLLSERPILVGGLALATGLGLLGEVHDVFLDSTTLASLVAAGAGIWWWRRQHPASESTPPKPVTLVEREAVEAALAALQTSLSTLRNELAEIDADAAEAKVATFENQRQVLVQELDRAALQVAIAGAPRSGKTTLIDLLKTDLLQTPSEAGAVLPQVTEISLTAEVSHPEVMATLLVEQDAVIYLVTEDLTESVLADLKRLTSAGQRVLLAFNKGDHYLPEERQILLDQIKTRLQILPQVVSAVAIATAPKPIKVRTHTADGQVQERLEDQKPDISPLTTVLKTWHPQEVPHLVTQTVMRQTHHLRQEVQTALNQVRREQALPKIEQLQWTAAATAFASPLPSLDLLAAIAINGQLVMDLGQVYHQPLTLDQAKQIATELAAIVVKLGLVEISTQLLTTALKTHAATYVVGGGVQAFSAAYLTRLCGESLMAYFEDRALAGQTGTELSVEAIGQKLQSLLPVTQRSEFLQTLVKQGIQKLTPKARVALPAGTTPALDCSANSLTVAVAQPETVPSGDSA